MNRHYWFLIIIFGMVISFFAFGCMLDPVNGDSPVEQAKRMSVVDSIYTKDFPQNHQTSHSFRLYIVKVDDKEYIVNSRGGIVEHKND